MSIRLMTLVWDIEFPTQSQKLLMLKLADYASDSGGSVFPATETLAEKAGCDERTVQRAMKAFRQCGILHLVKAGGTAPGATNEWQLNVPLLGWLADETCKLVGSGGELEIDGNIPDITPGNLTGGKLPPPAKTQKGVTPVSPTPGTTATQSVNNHQIDPSRASERASDETARAPAARKYVPQFTITPADSPWHEWIAWLLKRDRQDIVAAAEEARRMDVVGSKWPHDDSPLPRVDRKAFVDKRKTGEAA